MLKLQEFYDIITRALAEDIGVGDITSNLLIPENKTADLAFVAREEMVSCGVFVAEMVYKQLNASININFHVKDGELVEKNTVLATATGNARALLAGERVALNLMQRMCGIASLTHKYVEAVSGTNAIILDTRKTMPNLRIVDKYSVKIGGGQNHRFRLDDMVLIKDNHIALCGGIASAVVKVRAGTNLPIVVECDTLAQVAEAIKTPPTRILLDNMSLEMLREAVEMACGKVKLEASGGVNLNTVRAIAETGVDYISVGALTHSAPAADIGADIMFNTKEH